MLGLKEKTERKLKEIDAKNRKLTPWEEYREKRAKKKLEKKEAKAVHWQYLVCFLRCQIVKWNDFVTSDEVA